MYLDSIKLLVDNNQDLMIGYHNLAHTAANNTSLAPDETEFYVPGTAAFDSAFNYITTHISYADGGTRFYDKSALYHLQGEYKFTPKFIKITVGGNIRLYKPNSRGTIFSDTTGKKLSNLEYGIYTGAEKKLLKDKLKLSFTARLDKNQNFNFLISPAASVVYTVKKNTFRFSFSSAIRNPTLGDQYLYYNVG
ncbi:MAG: TonB-dependent receptor, partial [Ignavibacteria bacterium]|nr:TonB-dependent receptor [Ignavibacteria bacterium]